MLSEHFFYPLQSHVSSKIKRFPGPRPWAVSAHLYLTTQSQRCWWAPGRSMEKLCLFHVQCHWVSYKKHATFFFWATKPPPFCPKVIFDFFFFFASLLFAQIVLDTWKPILHSVCSILFVMCRLGPCSSPDNHGEQLRPLGHFPSWER